METPTGSGCSSRPDRTATPRLSERKRRLFGSPVTRMRKINDDEDEDVDILGVSPLKPHVAANKPNGGGSLFTAGRDSAARRRFLRVSPNSSPETNKENKTGRGRSKGPTANEEQLPHLFTTTMRLNSNSSSSQNSSPRTPKQGRRRLVNSSMSSPSSEGESPAPRRESAKLANSSMSSPSSEGESPAARRERAKPKSRQEVSESSTRRSPRNAKAKETIEPESRKTPRISPRRATDTSRSSYSKATKSVNNSPKTAPQRVAIKTTELGQESNRNRQKSPVPILKPTTMSMETRQKSPGACEPVLKLPTLSQRSQKSPKSPVRSGEATKMMLVSKTPKSNIEILLDSEDEDEVNEVDKAPRQQPQKRLHLATPSVQAVSSTESDSGSPQSKLRRMNPASSIPTMAFYSHSETGASRTKGTQANSARGPQPSKAKTSPKSRPREGINKGVRHKIRKRRGFTQHLPPTNLNHILSCLGNERLKNLITTKREERAKVEEVHEILRRARDPIKMAKPLSMLGSDDANNNNSVSAATMWQDTGRDFSDLSEDEEEKADITDPVMELEPIIPLIRHESTVHTSPPAETVDLSKRKFFKSGRRSSTCMEVRITDNIRASVSQGKIALVQTHRRKPRGVRIKSSTIFSAEQATVDAILKNLDDSVLDEIVESEPKAAITPMEAEPLPDIIEYAPEPEPEDVKEIDPFAEFRQRLPYQTDDPELMEQQQILLEFLISNNICTEQNFEIFIANPDNHKEEANQIVDDLYMVVNSEEAAQVAQMEAVPPPAVEDPLPPSVPEDAQPRLFPIFTQRLQPIVQKSSRRRPNTSMRLLSAAAGGSNQYQIDAGQKAFGARQCQQCGLVYTVHEPEEEQLHREYHNSIHVLRFKCWIDEDIVAMYPEWANDGRIIRLNERAPAARLERLRDLIGVVDKELGYSSYIVPKIFVAFMAVRKQQIVGFCLVQPLSQAHRFIQVDGTDYFSEETYHASCGVSRIWVAPLHRRGGIASKLMRAVQCHTILGQEIAIESIAFSTPTDDGRALARKLTGLDNFLTYDQ